MKKRLSILLIMCCLFSILCGCEPTPEINITDNSIQPEAIQIPTETKESTDTQNEDPPGSPREDLDVEVAPDINSLQELMRVHFIDVGQADSIFIELSNGQTMLIDAGRSGNASTIINYIRNLQYSDIDFVVVSHPHDDHIGSMADVLNTFKVGKMYMPRQAHTTKSFDDMLDAIENNSIDLYTAKAGTNILTSGIITIDILAPFADSYSNLNNCSSVVRLTYGETVMLFTGDAETEIESQLLDSGIDADVLKVSHHGAGSASSASFIKAVSPEVAVISVGKGNSYKHPHAETLAILNEVGADIYRTDEVGTVIVTADHNKKITVDKKASTVKENAPPVVVQSTEETQNETVTTDNQSQVVYRTKTGKKYHIDGCSYLKSRIQTTVSEAQSMGLGPCSRCNPPR